MSKHDFWTPERIARLKALRLENQPFSVCADLLGAPSRSAIASAVRRYIVSDAEREDNLRRRAENAAMRARNAMARKAQERARIAAERVDSKQRGARASKSYARGAALSAHVQRERAFAAALRKPGGVYVPKFAPPRDPQF